MILSVRKNVARERNKYPFASQPFFFNQGTASRSEIYTESCVLKDQYHCQSMMNQCCYVRYIYTIFTVNQINVIFQSHRLIRGRVRIWNRKLDSKSSDLNGRTYQNVSSSPNYKVARICKWMKKFMNLRFFSGVPRFLSCPVQLLYECCFNLAYDGNKLANNSWSAPLMT